MSQKTVLIADDSSSQRNLIEILLSAKSLDFVSCTNGKEVLEYLRNDTPDIALLDADMPYLGGFEICSKMKRIRRLSYVPVIVLTPPNYQDDTDESQELVDMTQVDLVIAKPLSDKNLRQRVADLLRKEANPEPSYDSSQAPPAVFPNIHEPSSAQGTAASVTTGGVSIAASPEDLASTLLIEDALAGMHTMQLGNDNASVNQAFPQATLEQKFALLESENKMLRKQVDELDREVRALRSELGRSWE